MRRGTFATDCPCPVCECWTKVYCASHFRIEHQCWAHRHGRCCGCGEAA